ncbi:hypothetical protein D3C71_71600 [compost metagenome]
MNINIYITSIKKGKNLIKFLLMDEFNINEINSKNLFKQYVKPSFDNFKDETYILAETEYVDKVYRDSYYHYYSSKLPNYKRNCIRLSFFEGKISDTDFRDKNKYKKLQQKYRGFIVLRPTDPFIIGRSVISPLLLKNNNFTACVSKFHTTVYGLKFTVKGFPHSSQDTETISCAETSLWAIMEYFSNKYSDYQPLLPSKITNTLRQMSSERQIPSKGLSISEMSYALKEFGFGARIYSKREYGKDFEGLLSCYVESGIPIIVTVDDEENIAHALLAIGHTKVENSKIDAMWPHKNSSIEHILQSKNIKIYDFDTINKDFIFIDDNQPSYQRASLNEPTIHYSAEWHKCKITHFIVPLYTKIYLEAYEAKNYILEFLTTGPEPLIDNSTVLLRTFLASSRSFKHEISKNETIQDDLKSLIIESAMPKFIWITEISSKELMKNKMANGLIILDATQKIIYSNKPLIIAAYQEKLILFDEKSGILQSNVLTLPRFQIFEHNLNNFEI